MLGAIPLSRPKPPQAGAEGQPLQGYSSQRQFSPKVSGPPLAAALTPCHQDVSTASACEIRPLKIQAKFSLIRVVRVYRFLVINVVSLLGSTAAIWLLSAVVVPVAAKLVTIPSVTARGFFAVRLLVFEPNTRQSCCFWGVRRWPASRLTARKLGRKGLSQACLRGKARRAISEASALCLVEKRRGKCDS